MDRTAAWPILALVAVMMGCGSGQLVSDDDADPTPGDDDTTAGDDDTTAGDDDTTAADDDTTGDDDSTGDDDTTDVVDCGALPTGPLPYAVLQGPRATEDLAFDDQGHLIGADSGNLFRSTRDGQAQLWIPGPWADITGLRALPTGDIVYADTSAGSLVRVDSISGEKTTVLGGLSNPDGLEVDLDGYIYVAEQASGMVRRVDPITGEFVILATGLFEPNGLSFDPTYTTLYVDSYGGGVIHAIEVGPDGQPLAVDLFTGLIGTGFHDGMAVDACGNVYVCDYGATTVYRVSPDATVVEALIDLGQDSYWIPNMQWGSGIGGWDERSLYVNDIEPEWMYEVPTGVPGKPRPYP